MKDRLNRTELHNAVVDGDRARVKELLRDGADPDVSDARGFTPLHFAALWYAPEITRLLLGAGAAVDPLNAEGNTPLTVAVFNSEGRGEVIEALLAAGADRHRPNRTGISPLDLAGRIANYDITQFFDDA